MIELKGKMLLVHENGKIAYYKQDKEQDETRKSIAQIGKVALDDYDERYYSIDNENGNYMDGLEFLHDVQNGCISNYDGFTDGIVIDGYKTNLGLWCNENIFGEFLVSEKDFEFICKNHEVKVLWFNK